MNLEMDGFSVAETSWAEVRHYDTFRSVELIQNSLVGPPNTLKDERFLPQIPQRLKDEFTWKMKLQSWSA